MKVPFLGLERQYTQHRQDYLRIADTVFGHGQVLQGPEVTAFENALAKICRRSHAVALGSCTDAIAFALQAGGVGSGDEVLVPAVSFIASASAIVRVGARPRFVDLDPEFLLLSTGLIDPLVTARTRAILAVHLYGQSLPMGEIEAIAHRRGLIVVEDAAQALGSRDQSRPCGTLGVCSCLSFDPTKVIGSFSSAGACVTDDPGISERLKALRYHGRGTQTGTYDSLGYNSQLPTVMAALLSYKLERMEEWRVGRERIARIYLDGLADLDDLVLPRVRPGTVHNRHKFVVRTEKRDALKTFLAKAGIETRVHYPRALPDEPLIASLGLAPEAMHTPNARAFVKECLSLPIFAEMTEPEAAYVVDSARNFFRGRPSTG